MSQGVSVSLFQRQLRVFSALTIREMEAQWDKYTLGYFWALVEPAIYIAMLSLIRVFLRQAGVYVHDMPPVMFVIVALLPWRLFLQTTLGVYRIQETNKQLKTIPRVTSLDLVVSKALSEYCTYVVLFFIFAIPASIYEGVWPPRNILQELLYFHFAWFLGIGAGLTLMPVYRYFPALDHFVAIFTRVGFWTSGLFFVVDSFPTWVWPYLALNPALHISELMREAWFEVYDSPIGDPLYVLEWIIGLMFVGVIFDRLLRRVAA